MESKELVHTRLEHLETIPLDDCKVLQCSYPVFLVWVFNERVYKNTHSPTQLIRMESAMNATASLSLNDTTTSLHVQRASFAPSNRELGLLVEAEFGRGLESFQPSEVALARIVFAQVALMAGAALAADSETFVGADRLWRDMQDRIGSQERALAKHFLEVLSKDEYYSESERHLIAALAKELVKPDQQLLNNRSEFVETVGAATMSPLKTEELPVLDFIDVAIERVTAARSCDGGDDSESKSCVARSLITLDDTSTSLHVQRASLAPSNREIALLVEAKFGRGLDSFKANELALARVVFAQVALMAGAALSADSETYCGAEELWRDMLEDINPQERALAKHFLEILSKDEYYSESERHMLGALGTALLKTEGHPLRIRVPSGTHCDQNARGYVN